MPVICDDCGNDIGLDQATEKGNSVYCEACQWPVERKVYVHDEYAAEDIESDLYSGRGPRVGYEVELTVRYYEDGSYDIIAVNGNKVEE